MDNGVGHHGSVGSDAPAQDLAPLLRAASGGDERAWRELVELYARRIYALARSRLGSSSGGRGSFSRSDRAGPFVAGDDAAEEVTQSVFCTVASQLRAGTYTEQGRFEAWLFRIAMNRIRDEVRRRRRQAEPTDPEVLGGVEADEEAAGAQVGDGVEFVALRSAMGRLTEPDREIIELRHHGQMSFKQIAEMLDEPLGTLLARHHRALRKLKELMTGEGGLLHGRAASASGEDS